jgi:hypothetical protein
MVRKEEDNDNINISSLVNKYKDHLLKLRMKSFTAAGKCRNLFNHHHSDDAHDQDGGSGDPMALDRAELMEYGYEMEPEVLHIDDCSYTLISEVRYPFSICHRMLKTLSLDAA